MVSKDNTKNVGELIRQVEPEDLIKYGLIPEFTGRLPVIATLDELDIAALIRVLSEPKNALMKQYMKLFAMDAVELEFTPEALEEIAKKAIERKSGARGLRAILENVLLDIMYDLPSKDDIAKVIVDLDVVQNLSQPKLVYKAPEDVQIEPRQQVSSN